MLFVKFPCNDVHFPDKSSSISATLSQLVSSSVAAAKDLSVGPLFTVFWYDCIVAFWAAFSPWCTLGKSPASRFHIERLCKDKSDDFLVMRRADWMRMSIVAISDMWPGEKRRRCTPTLNIPLASLKIVDRWCAQQRKSWVSWTPNLKEREKKNQYTKKKIRKQQISSSKSLHEIFP